ncbi:MAG TPA: DUF3307 domain-containing protein [Elusimicrobiales bacterium]|nr:DUF3307 domain-containing protein [Elusimicrobiales bacterium]
MAIFWRLLLSHLLADFTLQFDIVNKMKRKNVWGMALHCLTHLVTAVALTYPHLREVWFTLGPIGFNGWAALAVMLAAHFLVDELRIYSMKRMGYPDGTIGFLADQVMHVYVLFMIAPIARPGVGFFMPERWVGIAAMSVLVAHVTTVLIYFIEKDLYGTGFPRFDEKYFLIFERVVLWSFFFTSGWLWLPFAAAWTVQIFYIRRKRILDLSLANIYLSLGLTSAAGLWTRYIYFGHL